MPHRPQSHPRVNLVASSGPLLVRSFVPEPAGAITINHSARNATIGSTFVAVRAGMRQASAATPANITTTATNTAGANGCTSEEHLLQQAGSRKRPEQPERESDSRQAGTAAQNELNWSDRESKRGADASFPCRADATSALAMASALGGVT